MCQQKAINKRNPYICETFGCGHPCCHYAQHKSLLVPQFEKAPKAHDLMTSLPSPKCYIPPGSEFQPLPNGAVYMIIE